MRKSFILLAFFTNTFLGIAQNPVLKATRINESPIIDGNLDDAMWKGLPLAGDFKQNDPVNGGKTYQRSEIKVAYDDRAIYVGAMLYDNHPDSILKQLGQRDENNLNADFFIISFDTYGTKQDAYYFGVYVSGVQFDYKELDGTYDAVWESTTRVTAEGWCVEMRIPYSALRFPDKPIQSWGMNIQRLIRRNRETDNWAIVPLTASRPLNHWGTLEGLSHIKPPLRLSLVPYISGSLQNYPYNTPSIKNTLLTYSAGADIKYGIDERFTLDMILLPDFSQVVSDNYVKNITPFETVYNENRPFFKEGTELFQKGNLFYSRRIGRIPTGHDNLPNTIDTSKEHIVQNPNQTKLLNATKVSGRTAGGLGIGVFNAVTANTYATIEDKASLNSHRQLTEPLTNYNIIVFDQQLKHNSSAYLINTNASRANDAYHSSNVTGTGLSLDFAENNYQVNLNTAASKLYTKTNPFDNGEQPGYRYDAAFNKIKGNFLFFASRSLTDHKFNPNDLGLLLFNNFIKHDLTLEYNIYKPFGNYLKYYNTLDLNYNNNYTSGLMTKVIAHFNAFAILKSYFSYYYGFETQPVRGRDYYEPRTAGRYYQNPEYIAAFAGISSDYRNPLALDLTLTGVLSKTAGSRYYKIEISPLIRPSDKFTFRYTTDIEQNINNVGYATTDGLGNIIFGVRNINTISNTFSGEYLFTPNMNLSLKLRHYWSSGIYAAYKTLLAGEQEGQLADNITYTGNTNFNTNFFNIDLVYDWRFAPGSNITIVYKNAIQSDSIAVTNNYFSNVDNTLMQPMLNSFSIKVLYYLDYQYLIKRKTTNDKG